MVDGRLVRRTIRRRRRRDATLRISIIGLFKELPRKTPSLTPCTSAVASPRNSSICSCRTLAVPSAWDDQRWEKRIHIGGSAAGSGAGYSSVLRQPLGDSRLELIQRNELRKASWPRHRTLAAFTADEGSSPGRFEVPPESRFSAGYAASFPVAVPIESFPRFPCIVGDTSGYPVALHDDVPCYN